MTANNSSSHSMVDDQSQILQDEALIDNFGRRINYVRIAVTDRCNLRCVYCMPERGIQFLPKKKILSYEELERLVKLLAEMGINKVRITGGEPFVRQDLIKFLWKLHDIEGIDKIHLTTNGVLTARYLPELQKIGVAGINLSLDTLDEERFFKITRRDNFDDVMNCLHQILEHDIPLKINMVVMEGQNTEDIIPMTMLTRDYPLSVRFIEEMPFNGTNSGKSRLIWNYQRIMERLEQQFPEVQKLESAPTSTSMNFQIPGHRGNIGIIAGFSRTFCGACNRIRITAKGMVKTCLYSDGSLNIKQLLRSGVTDDEIKAALRSCINTRFKDGWEAQKHQPNHRVVSESMSVIGG